MISIINELGNFKSRAFLWIDGVFNLVAYEDYRHIYNINFFVTQKQSLSFSACRSRCSYPSNQGRPQTPLKLAWLLDVARRTIK